MADRTVHARTADGIEIVRYDRAGKWYAERVDSVRPDVRKSRRLLKLAEAVELASRPDSEWFFNRSGGAQFDRRVRLARKEIDQ